MLALLSLGIWLSTTSSRPRDNGRPGSAEQLAAAAAATAAADSSMGRPGDGRATPTARPLYGLPQPELESAVVAASERHGPVTKAGPVPQEFWTDERRPWRERVFLEMLKRGALSACNSDQTCCACNVSNLLRCFSTWLLTCPCQGCCTLWRSVLMTAVAHVMLPLPLLCRWPPVSTSLPAHPYFRLLTAAPVRLIAIAKSRLPCIIVHLTDHH